MRDDRILMDRHIEALYTLDGAGQLLRVRVLDGLPAPRVFVGRTANAVAYRFRADVAETIRREVVAACDAVGELTEDASLEAPAELARLTAIVARSAPVDASSAGPAFAFSNNTDVPAMPSGTTVVHVTRDNVGVLRAFLPAWMPDVHHSPPLFAVRVDGNAVAVCGSVRITPRAHEAGVETAAAFRGRGYAALVVATWAQAVRAMGAEPLYSTSWANTASRTVARKLGLLHFGNDLHVT
jgi:RimJ/RimL family protein N-acetyltransferase